MQLGGRRRSSNVDDRRSLGGGKMAIGGAGIGCGTVVIGIVLLLLGVDPMQVLSLLSEGTSTSQAPRSAPRQPSANEDAMADFASAVLADTEETWTAVFQQGGSTYRPPTLVLFTDRVRSACGTSTAAVGPFYCPGDQQVYIDLSFFEDLGTRYGAPGDFAQAYVLAHEVGHHIQTLLGTSGEVRQAQSRMGQVDANALSVKLELQADCYAGIWGHYAAKKGILSEGDMEEGLRAAHAIGDDRLQRQARGTVTPDSFTHGSSEQRGRWLQTGLQSGDIDACDTFR